MREALELVKREFGSDAVIFGTRSAPAGALGRLVGRDVVEITAAPAHAAVTPGRPGRTDTTSPQPARANRSPTNSPKAAAAPQGPTADPSLPAAAGPPTLPEDIYPYYTRLVQNEVAADLAGRLLAAAARTMPSHIRQDPHALSAVLRRCIARMVPTAPLPEPAPGQTGRVALVGPCGGGKTTTLVKLAAHLKLRARQSVGLLSLDTQRLGASDQLRRYAEIIQVPMETAQSIAEVHAARQRMAQLAWLLIDTSGVGLKDNGRFARLGALLRAAQPDEVHLVLAASTTTSAQLRLAQAFAPLRVSRVVITRLDEAVGFGVILNVIDRLRLKLSYVATGQNVPQDLEPACSARLAELILPGEGKASG
jgi:flagellar biosynthesis protein FlhF